MPPPPSFIRFIPSKSPNHLFLSLAFPSPLHSLGFPAPERGPVAPPALFLIGVVFNFFNFSAAAPKMCTEGWSAVSSKRGICIFETRSRLITLWDRVTLRNIITRYNNNNNNCAGYCSKHGVTRRHVDSPVTFFERTTQRVLSFCIFIRVKRREASPSKMKWIGLF